MRMPNIFRALAAVLIAASPVAGFGAPEPPAAVLLGCRGEVVVVKNAGDTITGRFGMALEPGDEVRTGKDSQAEVHFDNGQWVQIGANSSTQIHGRKAADAEAASMGERSFQVVQNFIKLKDPQGTSSIVRLRSGEKHATLRALSPVQTKIRDISVTFRWTASDPATELRLILYTDKGIHWEEDLVAGTTEVAYPPDAPVLEPGVAYSWVVETTDPLVFPAARSEAAFFEILSAEEGEGLDAALAQISAATQSSASTHHLFRASVFFDHGLMENAIAETAKALEVDPENSDLHAILARLYAETGRTQEALKEYDELLEKR
jgi:hypothetical protein